ncbi:MAG: hypothetical protein HZA48_10325 [Planctomycetes bacterium]|nr:hypothetical protein [Planctomycetota bacterium]
MKKIAIVSVLLGSTAMLIGISLAQEAKPKDNIAEICYGCHKELRESFAGKTMHKPVEKGNCTACHNPHASKAEHLMKKTESKTCLAQECHAGQKELFGRAFQHTPVKNGQCSPCHEPHASKEKHMLKKASMEICADCHNIKKMAGDKTVLHGPFRDGQCLACHDAHSGNYSGNIIKKNVDICTACHAANDKLKEKHDQFDMSAVDCTICHSPHYSGYQNMLKAVVHKPVGEKACDKCHENLTGNKPDPKKLVKPVPDLCFECHDKKSHSASNVHKPDQDGNCLTCHEVHASDFKHLLNQRTPDLCFKCHKGMERFVKMQYPHNPVMNGECNACHSAHSSENKKLLVDMDYTKMCMACHKKRDTHPVDKIASNTIETFENSLVKLDANRKVVCISCHNPHGSDEENILHYNKERDLCIQCHKKER